MDQEKNLNEECARSTASFDASIFKDENLKYISPVRSGLNQIPIIASSGFANAVTQSTNNIKLLEECNFNVSSLETNEKNFSPLLQKLSDLNSSVNLLISHPMLYEDKNDGDFEKFFATVGNSLQNYNKFFGGFNYKDEPHWDLISDEQNLEKFQFFYNRLSEMFPNKTLYINLIGSAQSTFTGKLTYRQYLNKIQEIFHPQVWSFDIYPLYVKRQVINDNIYEIVDGGQDSFYDTLEAILRQSQLSNRPFWYYCQCMSYINMKSDIEKPEATYPFLRYQVFNAIAYGARGIAYWAFRQRPDALGDNERYLTAPIDLQGNKTPVFFAVQKVNSELLEYDRIFNNANVMKIVHVGEKEYSNTCRWKTEDRIPFGPVESAKVECPFYSSSDVAQAGIVMSHLATPEMDYLMIVSSDPLCVQQIQLKFADRFLIKEYTPIPNKGPGEGNNNGFTPEDFHSASMDNPQTIENQIKRMVLPGAYLIFSWEKR